MSGRLGPWIMDQPDAWLSLPPEARAGGLCDADLCRTPAGECFVFAVLELPLIGAAQAMVEFGVWGALGEDDFRRYYETYADLDQSKLGPLTSGLGNEIGGFAGSLGLKAKLLPQDGGERPLMRLEAADHPLAAGQQGGIRAETLLQMLHAKGAVA